MGSVARLGGWWRLWVVLSGLWIATAAYRIDWRGSDLVVVHTEPYSVEEGLGVNFATGQLMTDREKHVEQRSVRARNEASFNNALTRGYLSAKCWGTMLDPAWDTEYSPHPEISWRCDSTGSKLWRYGKNGLTLLSLPVLVPLGLLLLRLLLGWIAQGFRLKPDEQA